VDPFEFHLSVDSAYFAGFMFVHYPFGDVEREAGCYQCGNPSPKDVFRNHKKGRFDLMLSEQQIESLIVSADTIRVGPF